MERFAVTGYVPDKIANKLKSRPPESLEIQPERHEKDVLMRVSGSDVAEVRTGSSTKGFTLVQLILRDGATVETVIRTTADVKGVARFNDPTISRLTAAATVKSIVA